MHKLIRAFAPLVSFIQRASSRVNKLNTYDMAELDILPASRSTMEIFHSCNDCDSALWWRCIERKLDHQNIGIGNAFGGRLLIYEFIYGNKSGRYKRFPICCQTQLWEFDFGIPLRIDCASFCCHLRKTSTTFDLKSPRHTSHPGYRRQRTSKICEALWYHNPNAEPRVATGLTGINSISAYQHPKNSA